MWESLKARLQWVEVLKCHVCCWRQKYFWKSICTKYIALDPVCCYCLNIRLLTLILSTLSTKKTTTVTNEFSFLHYCENWLTKADWASELAFIRSILYWWSSWGHTWTHIRVESCVDMIWQSIRWVWLLMLPMSLVLIPSLRVHYQLKLLNLLLQWSLHLCERIWNWV